MSYPTVRVPQCYDLERAAAALPPNASKLKVVSHSLASVASLPRRLRNPPPRQSKLEYAPPGEAETWTITDPYLKLYRLRDVLERRHCSPLRLDDFEYYLAYTEHSVENLYFMMWLRAYTDEHASLDQSDQPMAARLSHSVISATRTYVKSDAPYEINLNDQNRSDLLALPTLPPPLPSVYDAARKEVEWLLEDSLRRWEKNAKSNAGWRRLAFSTYVGLANACITVLAMVIGRIYMHGSSGRILAACLTPWLWFSVVGIICGLKGVCLLCFTAGGNVRQVSSFELAHPQISLNIHSIATSVPSGSFATLESPVSPQSDNTGYSNDPFSPHSERGSEFIIKPAPNLHNRPAAAPKANIVKFWAPMVEVEDPLIIRAYWETVVKGFLWSLLPSIPIGVIAAAA